MRKFTHMIIGITAGVAFAYFTNRMTLLYPVIGGFFGIAPDFDIFLEKLGIAGHRGAYSHSLLSSVVVSAVVFASLYYVFVPRLGLAWNFREMFIIASVVFCATFLHTVTDSLTRGGTKLFYPFYTEKIRGRIKYDDWLINGLLVLLCLVVMAILGREIFVHYWG
jgi:membrane-bound metal-dependent hydrolase YbcI (DUF457 family)